MELNDFVKDTKGIIHVGAHKGNERKLYRNFPIDVIFVEASPYVYEALKNKTGGNPRFTPLNYLVTDVDDKEYDFNVSSNRGLSSSIYDLKLHKEIWGNVSMGSKIKLKSITIPTMLARNNLDPKKYDALVMDTQGSELLVLNGALSILSNFKYIMTEVADFEAYAGCCQLKDIEKFMKDNGFEEICRGVQVTKENVGSYYDIVYKRKN